MKNECTIEELLFGRAPERWSASFEMAFNAKAIATCGKFCKRHRMMPIDEGRYNRRLETLRKVLGLNAPPKVVADVCRQVLEAYTGRPYRRA